LFLVPYTHPKAAPRWSGFVARHGAPPIRKSGAPSIIRTAPTRFPIVICPTARRQTAPPGLSGPLSNHGAAAPLQHLNQRALWRDQLANRIYPREESSWVSWTYTFGS